MKKDLVIDNIYSLIRDYLSTEYTYHGIHHTQDVHQVTLFYIDYYGITGREAELLEIAAVGHDLGFIEGRKDHEKKGAKIVSALMSDYGYSKEDRSIVSNLIMSTTYPQNPSNFLEEILCDADLDYLGREDFDDISASLKEEWLHFNVIEPIEGEFDRIQIKFLKNHTFHTGFAKSKRSPAKLIHLEHLRSRQYYLTSPSHLGALKARASA